MPASSSTSTPTEHQPRGLILEKPAQPKKVTEVHKANLQSAETQPVPQGRHKQTQQDYSSSFGNGAQSSREGLNLVSSLIDVEPTKQSINKLQTDDTLSSRGPKNSKRRGSASSGGSLSDIIQDMRISPKEAQLAANDKPTKGTVC